MMIYSDIGMTVLFYGHHAQHLRAAGSGKTKYQHQ